MPPLVGWNDWPEVWKDPTSTSEGTPCMLSSDPGYIIYSSSGSFWVPMAIIVFVYLSIFYRYDLINVRNRCRPLFACLATLFAKCFTVMPGFPHRSWSIVSDLQLFELIRWD